MNGLGRKKKSEEKQSVFTKETLGVVLILFATLLTVCLITRDKVFYNVGKAINSFLFGCFGYFAYVVMALIFGIGVVLVAGKKSKLTLKFKVVASVICVLIALLGQVISISSKGLSYGEYLSSAYLMALEGGISTCSAGGLIIGIIAYPLNNILSDIGCYVVLSILILGVGYIAVKEYIKPPVRNKNRFRGSFSAREEDLDLGIEIAGEIDYPVAGAVPPQTQKPREQKLFITNAEDFALKSKKDITKGENPTITLGKTNGGLYMGSYGNSFNSTTSEEMQKKIEYIKTPAKIDFTSNYNKPSNQNVGTTVSENIPLRKEQNIETPISNASSIEQQEEKTPVREIPMYYHDSKDEREDDSAKSHAQTFVDRYADIEEVSSEEIIKEEPNETFRPIDTTIFEQRERSIEQNFKEVENVEEDIEEISSIDDPIFDESIVEPTATEKIEEKPSTSPIISDRRMRSIFGTEEVEEADDIEQFIDEDEIEEKPAFDSRVSKDNNEFSSSYMGFGSREKTPEPDVVEEKPAKVIPPINRVYNAPPLDLLERYDSRIDEEGENHSERMEIIRRTLENFHINTEPGDFIQGPTVTRYELKMPPDVSVKKVLGLADDLKMRLQSYNGIRIQAPVPGKDVIGIEVSNKHPVTVGLRELLENMGKSKPGELTFAIGKDVVGSVITDNLADGPHYLVAGGTSSGKSVCLNVMILSMIMRYSPEELQLILVDPKMVEFTAYEHLPHLVTDEIISDAKRAIAAFQWAIVEMERRYELFSKHKVSGINGYNSQVANDKVPKMPRIVIVVDELSNLMETCKKDMEAKILSLAQKARAAGIHLVLATQRPSVDIITGTIKANLPSRIALRLSNFADSNTIISEGGAEKLLGKGDMLYKNSFMSESVRYQGAFLSDAEKLNVVNYIKEHNEAYFDDEMQEFLDESTKEKQETAPVQMGNNNYDINDVNAGDPLFLRALWLAVNTGSIAVSQLQRRFRLGYGRAGGLVDRMEQLKFVSGNEGSKARKVLMTREEFIERFGTMDDSL